MVYVLLRWVLPLYPRVEGLQVRAVVPSQAAVPDDFVTSVFNIINRRDNPDTFELRVDPPKGWRLVGEPALVRLSPGEEERIFITLGIPPNTPAGRYRLDVTATSQGDPGITVSSRALIKVRRMAKAQVKARSDRERVRAGEEARYSLFITNRGNIVGTFEITVYAPLGWPVQVSEKRIELAPGEGEEVSVLIRVPPGAPPGRTEMTLRAGNGGSYDETRVYIEVLPG